MPRIRALKIGNIGPDIGRILAIMTTLNHSLGVGSHSGEDDFSANAAIASAAAFATESPLLPT